MVAGVPIDEEMFALFNKFDDDDDDATTEDASLICSAICWKETGLPFSSMIVTGVMFVSVVVEVASLLLSELLLLVEVTIAEKIAAVEEDEIAVVVGDDAKR